MIPQVVLNGLGALKHAIVNRDNVLWRMLRPAATPK
jgi:cytochrome b561